MSQILEVKNLRKVYGGEIAVDGVSFGVAAGEVVALLGPNGAGKTTTISIILGVLEATSGSVEILGKVLSENRQELASQMNFAAVYAHVPRNMTVWQNLKIFGLLYNVKNLHARIKELINDFELSELVNRKVGVLSSGEQTRVSLAKAYLNTPKLLLLDEPTASLDPSSAQLVRERIQEYAHKSQAAVLWTSHNMHEIEAVCDRVLFLSHGKILLEGNPRELPVKYGKKNLEELFISVAREPLSLGIVD